ncbi:phospholipase D-like domain-containing protein [Flavobacterium gilvum]|uniref:phospholipase D n=1 Tax=Flavobacterium gilvum TaxID=1492737 RepID=A0AAC9N7K5_9FLAO|nr:phospholipase D-like domain-containing protein [Flavobacterium gilvum]AOW11054.1 hypothetical protein EM308_17040 [Flavobacterium gilvum]KFC58000.1 hypothetical protein FEM08_32390 [Flavobacterium gilvum]
MNNEVLFNNIKPKIQEELKKSRTSVYLAVAWLTDDELFADLIQLSNKGIGIKIILNDDEINQKSGLNFSELYRNGGLIYFVDSLRNLMHNKFCIIDEKVTINGSFNWTRKASNNLENITIIRDEIISKQFLVQFNELTKTTYQSPEYHNLENSENLKIQLEKDLSYDELILRAAKRKENASYIMAIHDYRNALKINNDDKNILFDLAYCQSEVGDDKGTIENYSEYLKHYPNSSAAYNNRGIAYERLKEVNKAIEDYSSAILIDEKLLYYENRAIAFSSFLPKNGDIYSQQENVTENKSDYLQIDFLKKQGKNANQDYLTILKKFQDIDRQYYYRKLSEISFIILEYEMSLEYISRAMANGKEDYSDYYTRAVLYLITDNFENALLDINKALSYSPNSSDYKELLQKIKREKLKPKNWFKPNNVW